MNDSQDQGGTYIHGTSAEEQERLSLLNELLNGSSLRAMSLRPGDRVLDVGSGLGQLTRAMARQVRPDGLVVGIEREPDQIEEARRLTAASGEVELVEYRQGSVDDLPLRDEEWRSFDVAHARFVLEHLPEPEAAVAAMMRAVRPGGRIVLEDDNHELLRFWPALPEVDRLWEVYIETWKRLGNDPYVGRKLTSLLQQVGAVPRRSDMLFFGGCAGESTFEGLVSNFVGILDGARQSMIDATDLSGEEFDRGIRAFYDWSRQPDAVLWYATCWAEGTRPGAEESATTGRGETRGALPESSAAEKRLEASSDWSMLEFLAESAEDLSSTLRLEKVFMKIAQRVQLLLDSHLFCVLLWNEEKQLLEHSYSMKFGEHIEQEGGFPLGYGLSGAAAETRQPIRLADVTQDPRYVRFRHAEVEIRSELVVPLISRGRLVGVLDLESVEYDTFTAEHERTLSALGSHIASALENARLYETVSREERRMEEDLSTARKIQRGLLPLAPPTVKGLEIGVAHRAAERLSGDFYDFFQYSDGCWGVAVGDVAGKGAAAALLASLAVGLLRSQVIQSIDSPADLLESMNDHLLSLNIEHRFVALLVGAYHPVKRELTLSDSGVPQPLLLRRGIVEAVELTGVPLGRLENVDYQDVIVTLAKGDVVVLVSDGVEDCIDAHGEVLGRDGIEKVLVDSQDTSAQELADSLIAATNQHCLGREAELDDRTVVVLRSL